MAALLVEPRGHAPALPVMRDTEVLRDCGACSTSTDPSKDGADGSFYCINGGTVGGTAGSDCTCTSCATQDTKARAVRPPVRAHPPQCRQRTGATAPSTASTAALSAAPPVARTGCNADTVVPTARLQTPVLPPQWQARMGRPVPSTASTGTVGSTTGRARHGVRRRIRGRELPNHWSMHGL